MKCSSHMSWVSANAGIAVVGPHNHHTAYGSLTGCGTTRNCSGRQPTSPSLERLHALPSCHRYVSGTVVGYHRGSCRRRTQPTIRSRANLCRYPCVCRAAFDLQRIALQELERPLVAAGDLVEHVGTDPAALHAWVHANIALVPYAGHLRGPGAVLVDGTANSLDRAYLLAQSLVKAGYAARLVRGAPLLAAEQTYSVPELQTAPRDADDGGTMALAEALGDSAEETAAIVTEARQDYLDRLELAISQAELPAEVLIDYVADAQPETIIAGDHWWVEWQPLESAADAPWQALDPAQADGAAAGTGTAIALDALPEDLTHSVTLRLIAEVMDPAGDRSETLVEHVMPADATLLGYTEVICTPLGLKEPEAEGDAERPTREQLLPRSLIMLSGGLFCGLMEPWSLVLRFRSMAK